MAQERKDKIAICNTLLGHPATAPAKPSRRQKMQSEKTNEDVPVEVVNLPPQLADILRTEAQRNVARRD